MKKRHAPGMGIMLLVAFASGAAAQDRAADGEPKELIPLAEEALPDLEADRSAPGRSAIEEIVVTATKQDRLLREIPATIAVIDGQQLEQAGAQDSADFLKYVPGVNIISQDVGATKVTIRGISSELGTGPTTGILYGNVSFTDAFFPFVSLDPHPFDMHDVEVLKGPQGTLFGASALNGAVRYVPREPEFDALSVKYYAQYAQFSEGGSGPVVGGALNLPFSEKAALRLVAVRRETPGYTDDTGRGLSDVNEINQLSARLLMAWEPGESWRITAGYVRQDSDFPDESFADNRQGRLSRSNTPEASPKNAFYDFYTFGVEYRMPRASLVSESALVRKRFDQNTDISRSFTGPDTSQSSVGTFIFFDSDTLSQELRLVSNDESGNSWSWVAGVFWMDQPIESGYDIFVAESVPAGAALDSLSLNGALGDDTTSSNGQPLLGRQRSDVAVEELAVFGELTRTLGENWDLSFGLRGYQTDSGGVAIASGALYGGTDNVNDESIRERGWNPKLALRWRPSTALMAYGLISRGFRVGGIQPTASSLSPDIPKVFKSDTLWNYETGLRSQWLDRSLLVDLTLFHEVWDKPLLAQLDDNNPNPVAYYYDNVGGAQSTGLEATLRWRTPLDGLDFNLAGAYSRTETTKPFVISSGEEIAPGTTWPFAPRLQTVLGLSYQRALWGDWNLRAAISRSTTSKANANLLGDVTVFDYALTDLQLGLLDSSLRWPGISLVITNLFDKRGINQDTVTGANEPVHDVIYTRPRSLSVIVSGQF